MLKLEKENFEVKVWETETTSTTLTLKYDNWKSITLETFLYANVNIWHYLFVAILLYVK